MRPFELKDGRPCRLVLADAGPHWFGGPAVHVGSTPPNTQTPLHLFLTLDLHDPECPVRPESSIRYLPLYYPLKYGEGGAELQYTVVSDDEIRLLHLDPLLPDTEDRAYIQVAELPMSPAQVVPLEYDEARILDFVGGYFQPNFEDSQILDQLDYNNLIFIGGYRRPHINLGRMVCKNPECKFAGRDVWSSLVAIVPPIESNGSNDIWYQWTDAEFHFRLCDYCGTVIARNVAS